MASWAGVWAGGAAGHREAVWAWHVTITPVPGSTPPTRRRRSRPFGMLYALHRPCRPLPGERMGNSLAESWSESPDGRPNLFTLRPGLRFHNGDPCTAEDVQFSCALSRDRRAGVHANVTPWTIVDPLTCASICKRPGPLLTFLRHPATCAGLVVPKALPGAGGRGRV